MQLGVLSNSLTELSVTAMAEGVRKKKLSPVELADAHLARIEKLNPVLNAFVDVDGERVRRDAAAAETALDSGKLGHLHGVPISIKNSIEVAGLGCDAGTNLRAGYVAEQDAPLVARLRAAGAVILGVTNTAELLMAWESHNILHGRTNNPWDLSRTPGGSSGGEAAAIAACLSAGGVGSDGGGSIRVPAHFSGICGLKPTPGRIPSTGHFPNSAGPFALLGVVGPMARTVADLRVLFEVIQGLDYGDPCTAPVSLRDPSLQEIKAVPIGYFEDDCRTPVAPAIRNAVQIAANSLVREQFQVQPFRPHGLEEARQLWWKLFGVAGGILLGPMLSGREDELSPVLREFSGWTSAEPALTGPALLDIWVRRDLLRLQVLEQMKGFPILLCPVAAIPAFRHGERRWVIDGKTVEYLDAWSYSAWFNLLGFPAAVVPIGFSPEGLPIGVQIVGRPWEEELVLAVAAVIESECGGWRRPPL